MSRQTFTIEGEQFIVDDVFTSTDYKGRKATCYYKKLPTGGITAYSPEHLFKVFKERERLEKLNNVRTPPTGADMGYGRGKNMGD